VVVSEIRNLAGRSATATKEIKTLIKDSVEKVEEGAKLVNESGETLGGIVVSVKTVTDVVAEIAAASQEQSSGIAQVHKAVLQMDEMTQQNASLVEEASAACETVGAQAQELNTMVIKAQILSTRSVQTVFSTEIWQGPINSAGITTRANSRISGTLPT
jgi:methyl-accepting chemotaxis protein